MILALRGGRRGLRDLTIACWLDRSVDAEVIVDRIIKNYKLVARGAFKRIKRAVVLGRLIISRILLNTKTLELIKRDDVCVEAWNIVYFV